MSGYGWNSGYGNLNGGFNRVPPTYTNLFQEHCVICNHVFYSTEALINHYESHMRDYELAFRAIREGNLPSNPFQVQNAPAPPSTLQALLQTNYVRIRNQAPLPQRNLALGPCQPPLHRPIPPITRSTHTIVQQHQLPPPPQQQIIRQAFQRANIVPPTVNIRTRAPVAQPNQPVARPDEIELDFGDEDNSGPDGSINLDLTLGL